MMYKIHFVSTFANILIIYYNSWCLINKYIDIFITKQKKDIYWKIYKKRGKIVRSINVYKNFI